MKIYIVGTSGSGKSTLAQELSEKLDLKHIELDAIHFAPNWVERPWDEFIADVQGEIQAPNWVVCGNYSQVRDMLMQDVDLIIWLDYPFFKVFWQTTKRTLKRLIFKEPCCNGNYESWRQQFFSKYSIFLWVITTYRKRRKLYAELMQEPDTKHKWIVVSNEKQRRKLLGFCAYNPNCSNG